MSRVICEKCQGWRSIGQPCSCEVVYWNTRGNQDAARSAQQQAAMNASLGAQIAAAGQSRGYDGLRVQHESGGTLEIRTSRPARPVRVGDMVRHLSGYADRPASKVMSSTVPCGLAVCTGEGTFEYIDVATQWVHADGAPIDVEATLAELRAKADPRVKTVKVFPEDVLPSLGHADFLIQERLAADRDAARKRIAELEARERDAREALKLSEARASREVQRASVLSDEAGAQRTELTALKAELFDAKREIERLQRKVKR